MGQTERYGLYVLVFLIFLILGVSIWGGESTASGPLPVYESIEVGAARMAHPERSEGRREPEPRRASRRGDPLETSASAPATEEILGLFERPEAVGAPTESPVRTDEVVETPRPQPELAPTPAAPTMKEHVVVPGDSYSRLASLYLGGQRHTKKLMDANPKIGPLDLRPGMVLKIPLPASPSGGAVVASSSEAAPASTNRTYKLRRGDTIEAVAKRFFDRSFAKYVPKIMALNGVADARTLQIGQVLKIPDEITAAR